MRAHRRLLVLYVAFMLAVSSVWVPLVSGAEPGRSAPPAEAPDKVPPTPGGQRRGTSLAEKATAAGASLQAMAASSDLQVLPYDGSIITASRLAERIMGGRGAISNATFSGANGAAGYFIGGGNTYLVRDGIVLSSGHVNGVLGPNLSDSITTSNGTAGDADLDALVPGGGTADAAVLEFDMVPNTRIMRFDFVFASDEYNEFANTRFNDVFGFYIDGQNIALLPDGTTNITINSINGGNPLGTNAVNPQFYINNDLNDGGTLDTEMDGLTTVIGVTKEVDPGVSHHVKLAIADVGDRAYDSNVLIGSPNDCGSFNTDAATLPPNDGDAADAPDVTVKYDPRELVPENQPGFEAKAERVALEVRKRADRAVARYRQLGLTVNDDIEIRLVCDIGVGDPFNVDFEFELGPIDIDFIPDNSDGFAESEGKIKIRASAIRNAFKPVIDAGFPATGPGSDWDSASQYWAGIVDHEIFHTIQIKKVGNGIDVLDQLRRGNRLTMESGAQLGQDLQTDADNLPDSAANGTEYGDLIRGWFRTTPSIDTGPFYEAGAVFQYWGERFGTPDTSLERQVAQWYIRLIQPFSFFPQFDPDVSIGAMKEVLSPVDLYDALRDFYVSAYVRRAENIVGHQGFDGRYRFLDEEDGYAAGVRYPALDPEPGDLAAGPVEKSKTRADPLVHGAAEFYKIALPADTTQVRVTFTAQETGGVGPWNWFGGTSPTRLAFVPVAPDGDPNDGTTGLAVVGWFATGPRPDDGAQEFVVDVAGRSELGVIVVASDDDAAYTMKFEKIVGTAGLVLERPNDAAPAFAVAGALNQPIRVRARATIDGRVAGILDTGSFTGSVGGQAAKVTQVARFGDVYFLTLDPLVPLAEGTYPVSLTFGGLTRTNADAVVVGPAAPLAQLDAAMTTDVSGTSGNVRADALLPDGGAAGTPLHLALMLSEPLEPIVGATVTAAVTDPAGTTRTFQLHDRGGDGDGLQDDGVYGAIAWATDLPGTYGITLEANGFDGTGSPFGITLNGSVILTAKVDVDGDGVADSVEALFGLDPSVADDRDHDHDGLTLAAELARGTDPWQWDTDDGGENDASEVSAGRDPLAAADDGEVRSMLLTGRSLDGNRVELTFGTTDGTGTIDLYRFDTDDVASGTLLGTFPGTRSVFTDGPLPEGTYGYATLATGPTGAVSAPLTAGPFSSRADATFPSARMVVEGGRWETNDRDVTVAFFGLTEPVSDMRIAESPVALLAAPWVPFEETSTFMIGAELGEHRIHAQVRDASGLQSSVMVEAVDFDPVAPASSLGAVPALVAAAAVDVPFIANDDETFVANVELWVRHRASTVDPWGPWALEASGPSSPIGYTFAHGDGYYEFYSIAADGAGNREQPPAASDAATVHDSTPPDSSVGSIPASTGASTLSVPYVATDTLSGVATVELWSRYRPTENDPWGAWSLATTGTSSPLALTLGGAGRYELYTVAIDEAGNRELAPAAADAAFERVSGDTTSPTSQASQLPATTTAPTITIPYTASDDATGVATVELWARYRASLAATWGGWAFVTSRSSSPFTYAFAQGDGRYEFYTIAVDGAGNREAEPALADAATHRDAVDDPPALVFAWDIDTVLQCTPQKGCVPLNLIDGAGTATDDRSTVTAVDFRVFGIRSDGTERRLTNWRTTTARDGSFNSTYEVFDFGYSVSEGYVNYRVEVRMTAGGVQTIVSR